MFDENSEESIQSSRILPLKLCQSAEFSAKSSKKQSENQSTGKGSLTTKPGEEGHIDTANMVEFKKIAPENHRKTSRSDMKSFRPTGEKITYGKRKLK